MAFAIAVAVFAGGIASLPWDGVLPGVQPGTSFASSQQPDQKQVRSDAQPVAVTTIRRIFPPTGFAQPSDTGPAVPVAVPADAQASAGALIGYADQDAPAARPIHRVRSRAPPVRHV